LKRSPKIKFKMAIMAVLTVIASAAVDASGADLCRQYVDNKEYDRAIDECSRMLTVSSYPVIEAYNNRGIAYAGKRQYEQAVLDYARAIGLNPKFDKAYVNRGNAYWHLGKYEESFADYQTAIKLNPEDPNAYYNLACRHALRKNETEACMWLKKAVEKGFTQWEFIKKDNDLDAIRTSSCYREIMAGK
jgi:tetratricopeptide (TPR) repeat protein